MRHVPTTLLAVAVLSACGATTAPLPVDAGLPDAGTQDSGEVDAGTPDAGEPDAGPPDAGQPLTDFSMQGIRLADVGGLGKRILATVERESDGVRVGEINQAIADGNEIFHIPAIIADGESYTVRIHIDLDGNLQCDPPPPDGGDFGHTESGLQGSWSGLDYFFHTGWAAVDVCAHFP